MMERGRVVCHFGVLVIGKEKMIETTYLLFT